MPTAPAITLIIPVYNKGKYLNECLDSVNRQSIDKSELELLLVNDGSTDNSLAICEKFVNGASYARVIDKPNGGVSSARNAGILAAKGRYIAFLDADDALTEDSLGSIVHAFDGMDNEVDLLAYHLAYHHTNTGEITYHKRDKWLNKTGVYKLAENPNICQTTMNVVVKNRADDPILFDESLRMGEDQHFVTRHLLDKGTIGYCAEAEYCYVRDGGGASTIANRPLFAYEDMMRLYEFFIDVAADRPSMAEYARQLLLHNISWRLSGDMLFPDHLTGEEFERQNARLTAILNQVPAESYGRSPFLKRWHRAYLMKRYGCLEKGTEISFEGRKSTVSFPSRDYTWKTIAPKLSVLRLIECKNAFKAMLRFGCPVFYLDDQVSLEVKLGGTWQKLELACSSYDYWQAHEKVCRFFQVAFEIPFDALDADSEVEFRCFGSKGMAKGLTLELNEKLMAWRANCSVRNGSWLFANYCVSANGKRLKFKRLVLRDKLKRSLAGKQAPAYSLRQRYKKALKQHKGKEIWIYADLPSSPSAGNALLQFVHDIKQNDGVERFFITDCADMLLDKYPELKGHTFECGSDEHKVAMLAASVLLTSYKEKWIFYPFDHEEWLALGDFAQAKRIVYLQHGILHAHMPWYLGYDRTLFDYAVVSSSTESKILQGDYAYPRESLLETGAPRLDLLSAGDVPKAKKIACIPSWRSCLVGGNGKQRLAEDDRFLVSAFYKGLVGFLDAVHTSGILEEYGYQLDVKLHPNFKCYEQHFNFAIPNVNTVFEGINEAEYAVAITDFSSYVYDFIYSGARVMYFLPDEMEFRGGLNHYRELEIPLGSFGPYSSDPAKAAADLRGILASLEARSPSPYRKKAESFFLHRDFQARDRLYEVLSDLDVY